MKMNIRLIGMLLVSLLGANVLAFVQKRIVGEGYSVAGDRLVHRSVKDSTMFRAPRPVSPSSLPLTIVSPQSSSSFFPLSKLSPSSSSSSSPPSSSSLKLFRNIVSTSSDNSLDTQVSIESPSINSRRITASIIVNESIENVWKILTDYDGLSDNVPNLVKSYKVPSPKEVTRIFQEGAQKIIGFEFRASLMMDMTENLNAVDVYRGAGNVDMSGPPPREVGFQLVESTMFSEFSGTWTMVPQNSISKSGPVGSLKSRLGAGGGNGADRTKLTYSVFIRPKGPVPILALEWRIREDVPPNLIAVKAAAEALGRNRLGNNNDNSNTKDKIMKAGAASALAAKAAQDAAKLKEEVGIDWGLDETLGQYMPF